MLHKQNNKKYLVLPVLLGQEKAEKEHSQNMLYPAFAGWWLPTIKLTHLTYCSTSALQHQPGKREAPGIKPINSVTPQPSKTRRRKQMLLCVLQRAIPAEAAREGRPVMPFSVLLYLFPFSSTPHPPSTARSPAQRSAGQLLPAVNPVHGVRACPAVGVESRKAAAPHCWSSFVPQGLGRGRGDNVGHYHQHIWMRWPCLNLALQVTKPQASLA